MITITILSLIVAISLQNVKTKISPLTFSRITSIFLLYSALLAFNVLDLNSIGSGIGIYSGLYQVTSISQSMEIFIYLIGALVLMPWAPSPKAQAAFEAGNSEVSAHSNSVSAPQHSPRLSEYCLIILFTTLGASLLISSSDLISMYLSIELQSFAVYLLATIYRDSESSTSAGLKYFLLGGLSSCFILLGSGLIYSFTGLSNLEAITSLVSVTSQSTGLALFTSTAESATISQGYLLGLIVIVVGFLFKISAAPFHNWAPDVYDEVPTIITTWLTVMPKISIIIFLLELESDISLNMDYLASSEAVFFSSGSLIGLNGYTTMNILKNLLLISSLLSLVIGTVLGLAQYKIKRLLGYSTVSHVGFLLLALAINTEQSIESLIFYLLQYTITNLNVFLILLAFGYIINSSYNNTKNNMAGGNTALTGKMDSSYSDIRLISDLKGQFYSNPLLSLSFAVCLFSMAGIPPLMGFFAKQQVLYSASHSGYFFLSILAIIVSVISAYYYLQIIKVIHFDSDSKALSEGSKALGKESLPRLEFTNIHSMTISTLTLTILLFIVNPSILLNSSHLMALSIFTN